MADKFGSDYITIVDEDGQEFELEVLMSMEWNGSTYQAVIPAVDADEEVDLEVSILKNVEEDGELILCAIEDEQELETVYNLMMDALYEEEEDEEYAPNTSSYPCLVRDVSVWTHIIDPGRLTLLYRLADLPPTLRRWVDVGSR